MKKLDLAKYKKRMSCSVEITENKIDFWGYQRAEKRKMKSC